MKFQQDPNSENQKMSAGCILTANRWPYRKYWLEKSGLSRRSASMCNLRGSGTAGRRKPYGDFVLEVACEESLGFSSSRNNGSREIFKPTKSTFHSLPPMVWLVFAVILLSSGCAGTLVKPK